MTKERLASLILVNAEHSAPKVFWDASTLINEFVLERLGKPLSRKDLDAIIDKSLTFNDFCSHLTLTLKTA